jgi:heterodisulfide reductase subunit C
LESEVRVDLRNCRIGNIGPKRLDRCLTCRTCVSVCPASGLVPIPGADAGWDPRKAILALALGREQEVIDSKWPWVCTLCGRCQYQCPREIPRVKAFRACRTRRDRNW